MSSEVENGKNGKQWIREDVGFCNVSKHNGVDWKGGKGTGYPERSMV